MKNEDMMKIELKRLNVIDVHMAILSVIHSFENEINNENTSDERKRICQSSIDHRWQPLLDELKKQFNEQDK